GLVDGGVGHGRVALAPYLLPGQVALTAVVDVVDGAPPAGPRRPAQGRFGGGAELTQEAGEGVALRPQRRRGGLGTQRRPPVRAAATAVGTRDWYGNRAAAPSRRRPSPPSPPLTT